MCVCQLVHNDINFYGSANEIADIILLSIQDTADNDGFAPGVVMWMSLC